MGLYATRVPMMLRGVSCAQDLLGYRLDAAVDVCLSSGVITAD